MIQKFALALFAIFTAIVSQAQSYHPLIKSNAFWTYTIFKEEECIPMDPLNYRLHQSYYFGSDSLIGGHMYSQPFINSEVSCGTSEYDTSYNLKSGIFMREDTIAKKVFVYDPFQRVDTILYDFNAKTNDTLWSPYFTRLPFAVTYVESIDSVLAGDSRHKRWFCRSVDPYTGSPHTLQIIEGLGSDQGLLNDYNQAGEFEAFSFDCYSENGKTLWPDTGAVCNEVTGISNIQSLKKPLVFPNPFEDQFEVEMGENIGATLEVYNSLGYLQCIKSKNFQNRTSVATASWPAGLYEVVIRNNDLSFSLKILKE